MPVKLLSQTTTRTPVSSIQRAETAERKRTLVDIATLFETALVILASLGGGGAIVFGLSSFLGKVWATRLADEERARFQTELERYRNELQQLAEERRDALVRKRDVYGKVAVAMRIFLDDVSVNEKQAEKAKFYEAFDHASLWASEEVAQALYAFITLLVRHTADPKAVANDQLKNAYRDCLNAMRRDCGFPDTQFNYPVVTFK
jgi:hypothetical protein